MIDEPTKKYRFDIIVDSMGIENNNRNANERALCLFSNAIKHLCHPHIEGFQKLLILMIFMDFIFILCIFDQSYCDGSPGKRRKNQKCERTCDVKIVGARCVLLKLKLSTNQVEPTN